MTWYIRDAQCNTMGVYDNWDCGINWKEQQLYGSSRLGMWKPNINLNAEIDSSLSVWDSIGKKGYELNNHLGNVLAVVSDNRLQNGSGYNADVLSAQDYTPFGSQMAARSWSLGESYRYGFNGKENDNEVKGEGKQQDYGMRIYDSRLGRFLSEDPITKEYPELTPYQFSSNRPIDGIDLDGLEYMPNWSTLLFGQAGINTTTAKKVEQQVKDTPKQVIRKVKDAGPIGGTMMVVGYGLTLSGNPEFGVPLVKSGAFVSLASDVAEVANTYDEEGLKPSLKLFGKKALLEAAGAGLKLPIDQAQSLKEIDKEILRVGIDLKLKIVEMMIDKTTDKNKKAPASPVKRETNTAKAIPQKKK